MRSFTFNWLSIKTKLIVMLLFVSISSMCLSTYICSRSGQKILTEKVFDQLTSLRAVRKNQIQDYFDNLVQHTQTLSDDLMFIAAMKEFTAAYTELVKSNVPANFDQKIEEYYSKEFIPKLERTVQGTPILEAYTPKTIVARYLQYHYMANNSNPVGKKALLDDAKDGSSYSRIHARYNPIFRKLAERFGYYDMFLLDKSGDIVYTLSKEVDFGTNLSLGPYKESNLAKVIAYCRTSNSIDYVKIVDFEPYLPSYGAPSAFICAPIFEKTELIGILAFQLSIEEINHIMTSNKKWKEDGLGDTGETYLVGRDYLMRSASRFRLEDPEGYAKTLREIGTDEKTITKIKEYNSTILQQEVQTEAVKLALSGKEGTKIISDYRNIPVLSAYSLLNIDGLRWVILAEMDVSEAYASIYSFERRVLIAATLIMVVVTLVAMFLANLFTRPIKDLVASACKVGTGESEALVTSNSRDEFAELAKAFNETVYHLRTQTQLSEQKNSENEKLLLKVFPVAIAKRLKAGEKLADQISNVSVLFSDLHRFTKLTEIMNPPEILALLNELVVGFDELAEKYDVEKIKTIGDGYMAVCGLSVPRLDHDKRTVDFALEMLAFVRRFNYDKDLHLDLRIGINSGDVVAGIIGKNKLLYDVWGDTVNTANRLKSASPPGYILVSQTVCDRLQDLYDFERFLEVEETGKEKIEAWAIKTAQLPANRAFSAKSGES